LTSLVANPWVVIATAALLALTALVGALSAVRRRRKLHVLSEQIRQLLVIGTSADRLGAPERAGPLEEIATGVNQLLDRAEGAQKQKRNGDGLFEALAATLPDVALIHTDRIFYANRAAGELLGVDATALRGKQVTDLMRPAYRASMRKQIAARLEQNAALEPIEVQLINGDDRGLWAELYSRRVVFNGEPALLSVAKDITYRKSLEASLGRNKLQARVTLESIGEGVITTDSSGVIDYMNEAAEQLIGTLRSAALGKRLPDLITLVDEVDRSSLGDPVVKCLNERRRINLGRRALLIARQMQREFSTELTASPIRGPDGDTSGCVVIFHDVSEMRGLARRMSYQASHDPLTGLVNRAEFEQRLESALKSVRTESAGHVVAYLDLDRFKLVNDTCGHLAGDNLLREVASLLKDKIRDSDTVARVGGDEFAMLLVGCPLDKARQIADDVCQAVADHRFVWQDRIFDVGVSIGLVEVGPEGGSAESVLGAADSACYVAKQQGRGRVHVYSARDEIVARQRGEIHWLHLLQRALKENQFELHVQPIISVGGRVQTGPALEVLLRLRDDAGETILPAQFIGAAERYHLMTHIDRWVVQATLNAIASGALRLPDERSCGINLSGQTLADEEFLEFVVEALDRTGVDPGKLCFEIPESAIVSHFEHAQRFINVLHGIGCRFALDNFGSGIGSLATLKRLALDYLKIDGVYVRDLEQDAVNRAMVGAMVKLAKTLNFRVIAGQVEDQASFETVRGMGVDFIQGFVVEHPRPLLALH
jgi:diguanylate cyclase (GGDEF)-like protein/PAS domain S-box-containing protein